MPENSYKLEDVFRPDLYRMSPLGECVLHIAIKNTNSQMFLCSPWENILLWANKVADRYLPYSGTKFKSHYASLNYCISGRCEICRPDNTYIYMEPGMLCIDDHRPKDGYWYPGQNYSGLEGVFDLDRLLEHPIGELSAYCDYDGWIREMLSAHDGTYLGMVGNECGRLINLLYSHLIAADWNLTGYRLHLLMLFYALVTDGTEPVTDQFYVTKGQKHIAGKVEQMITRDLSRHYTISDMAAMYGVSPSALKKYFEVVYGLPISFYLRERRILLAKQRLSGTKESVGMIAAACGYSNQGKFKTVEQNTGTFRHGGNTYKVVDLPGTYSLAANSEEEIVTRDYIAGGGADLICILADASQLERSLFMLADYAGIRVPVVLLLNMMDVAGARGKKVDVPAIEKSLGIPVLPFVASEKKDYEGFYKLLERSGKENWILRAESLTRLYGAEFGETYQNVLALLPEGGISVYENSWIFAKLAEHDTAAESIVEHSAGRETFAAIKKEISGIKNGASHTGNCKFQWIDSILSGHVTSGKDRHDLGKFDRLAISGKGGKWLAAGIILLGLMYLGF